MLIPLVKNCFGLDVSIDYFRWKYLNNPAGHFIGFIAVESETNEVAAYYGVIPQTFFIEGKQKTIYQSCDTMTHSNHRRQGLFKRLALKCYDYLKENQKLFIIGFGGETSTPGFLKFGWKKVFDFRYYFKPNLLCQSARFYNDQEKNIFELQEFNKIERLFQQEESEAKIVSKRNVIHFTWRVSNPLYDYKTVYFSKDDKIEGYITFYIHNNKILLFDFIFNSNNSEKSLLLFLSNLVIKNKYKGIVSFCQENGNAVKILSRNKFITNPLNRGPLSNKVPFIFFAEDQVMEKFSEPNFWEIKSYDHDSL
ncbi:MAG: GNAT family N-acetyltransferase [Parachlamydiaceae bacterium]|nr:GNAT family N-acetyltransferase [Parachlamydiaceae bacterium]